MKSFDASQHSKAISLACRVRYPKSLCDSASLIRRSQPLFLECARFATWKVVVPFRKAVRLMTLHFKRCENMLGIRTITASALLLLSSAAVPAATPDYFPMQVGNSWVYKTTQGRISNVQTIAVEAIDQIDSRNYYRVQFFGHTVFVRAQDDGSLVSYDREAKQEKLWLPFAAPEGQRTTSEFDQCTKAATVKSRAASVKTLVGDFNNALHLTYEPTCADAGVGTQYFLPYVGLIQQESTSIAGPYRHELLYSRTGFTQIETGQVGFTIALDGHTYPAQESAEIVVRLTLRSSHPEPLALVFPSGQDFDIKIYDDKGETVYVWSADKLFAQIFRSERFGPGEKTFAVNVPIGRLPRGRYAAEGYFTTQPRMYSGIAHFEVR